ncbi:MAG: trehalose-phosphatase [Sphingomonas sp.]
MPLPHRSVTPDPPVEIAEGASLFLDFDGTLVELAERPDGVRVGNRLRDLMRNLHDRLEGRLAIVSGRPAAQVRHLFGQPEFIVAGCHGLEFHYADGRTVLTARPPRLDDVVAAMRRFSRDWPGVLVEEKPLGAALHFRQDPAAGPASIALASSLAAEHELVLQTGKMMIEVRAADGDKGTAIRALMADPPFAGTRPLFIGDDDTDEPGFAAAANMGGAGIVVGGGRSPSARYRLTDVAAVLDWLDGIGRP